MASSSLSQPTTTQPPPLPAENNIIQQEEEEVSSSSYSLLNELISNWKDQDEGGMLLKSLEYLDVVTLIQKVKPINKEWKILCTKAINNKCSNGKKKKFETRNELHRAVDKYSPPTISPLMGMYLNFQYIPTDAEEIASTYGYPINTWDVSNVTDFSWIFEGKCRFNEPIGFWDVSNATDMSYMFFNAHSFNQDISSWDVSKVTTMYGMFWDARSFNHDLSSWDTSSVNNFVGMFYGSPFVDATIRRLPWFNEVMLDEPEYEEEE